MAHSRHPPIEVTSPHLGIKPGKFLNVSGIKQGSFEYYCFDIQGAEFLMLGRFIVACVPDHLKRKERTYLLFQVVRLFH